jgi:cysteinyl-tRNA synthetase
VRWPGTSTVDEYLLKGVNIYPNPVTGNLIIEKEINEPLQVDIWDIKGRMMEVTEKTDDKSQTDDHHLVEGLMQTILDIRKEAKLKKDWATADKIRDDLGKLNIEVKDTKEGASWSKIE